MPVVSNTSPILNMAIIDQLQLLRGQFDTVLIPDAVLQELRVNSGLPGTGAVLEALRAGWLKVRHANDRNLIQLLRREIDGGEAETIALGIELSAKWVLLDERQGRKTAKSLGLNVIGLIGVILRADKAGFIPSLPDLIDRLQKQAGFRISKSLMNDILSEYPSRQSKKP